MNSVIVISLTFILVLFPEIKMCGMEPVFSSPVPLDEEVFSDQEINKAVNQVFAKNKELARFHIQVYTANGVVTLEGSVDSEKTRAVFGNLAKGIPGVKEVNSNIQVIPSR